MGRATLLLLVLAACSADGPVSPDVNLQVDGGRITITGSAGRSRFVLADAEVRVRVDGRMLSSADGTCRSEYRRGQPLVCELPEGFGLALTAMTGSREVFLTASVHGPAGARVDGFEILATQDLRLPASPDRLRYLHNGYQSWSFSGALDVPDGALPRTGGVVSYAAPNGNVGVVEKVGISSHSAVVDGGDGTAMLAGFVSARLWNCAVVLEQERTYRFTAQCGFTGDSIALPEGGSIASEELLLSFVESPGEAMAKYGDCLAERTGPGGAIPVQHGWFSWNRWFEGVDEATVLAQSDAMGAALGERAGDFPLILVDDGWEMAWGDWTPNTKFRPIAELSKDLHARGRKLGLWLAPFVVEETLPLVAEHPDWWVRTASGEPLVHQPLGTQHRLRVVDASQDAARAWVASEIARLAYEGVDFFKLDFLYAAALDGVRRGPSATGVSALSRAFEDVFAAAGAAGVNLCGVPWLHGALAPPSTMRIGNDVASSLGTNGFFQVADAARNLSARAFGKISYRSDPDQLRLSYLTDDEAGTALSIQSLAGPTFSVADDPSELSPAKLAALRLHSKLVEARPQSPQGLFDRAGTEVLSPVYEFLTGKDRVQTALPSVVAAGTRLAVTNWGDAPADIPFAIPSEWSSPPLELYEIADLEHPVRERVARLRSHRTAFYLALPPH